MRAGVTYRRGAVWLAAVLIGAWASAAIGSAPVTLTTVLQSAQTHYPQILSALEATRAREGGVMAAQGAFDLRLDQFGQLRPAGYYDGNTFSSRLVKPLGTLGAELYGGYRISDGTFPIYENRLRTRDGGEFSAGVILSLWRDRGFDQRRFDLARTRNELRKAEFELELRRILIQRDAAGAYLDWVAAGRELVIYRELLRLADLRQTQFADLVKEGALAQITLTENLQAVLRRRALVTDAERALVRRANTLSLFLRDAKGTPRVPSEAELPPAFPNLPPVDAAGVELAVTDALQVRPDAAMLAVDSQVEADRIRLSENLLKPRVNLNLDIARDVGNGPKNLSGVDTLLRVDVSIPIERRLGQGRRAEAQANLNRIRQEQRLLDDRIATEIRNVGNDIDANLRLMTITAEELRQAMTMQDAERERLAEGQSNFFLLNAREETTADVRIRNVRAERVYEQSLADFYAATVQWERLVP
jgi:outer membrane protein TolC